MKSTVSFFSFIGIVASIAIFLFWIDPMIVNWIMGKIPSSAGEWIGLIEVVVWIITIAITFSISIFIGYVLGAILGIILAEVNGLE